MSLSVAEKYVDAFGNLAKEGTAVVVPGNVGDMGGMIASAMAVYGKVSEGQSQVAAKRLGAGNGPSKQDSLDSVKALEDQVEQAQLKTNDVARSVLEEFDNTANKR